MGGKSGEGKIQVADYLLSQHIGICAGPVDEIKAIYIHEKDIGITALTANGSRTIDKLDLFGGSKKGGGVAGRIRAFFGGPEQILTSDAAARLGGTPTTVPGFRGILSLFFMGTIDGGFMWGSNNPTVPAVAVKVKRGSWLLDDNPFIGDDANPAHIIYECILNFEWGMGGSASLLNKDSYLQAAQTLRDEGFGLSLMWTRQTSIENFISEILDHISASHSIDPHTGLLTLTLLRKDYDVDTLLEINPDNAILKNYQRKSWGETANEINVTWTNPANEKEETITVHDNANIAIQGSVVSDSRNYYGVRNNVLAQRLGLRDVEASAAALAACDVEMDRTGWDIRPGSVLKLRWPEHGIERLVVRVGPIDYGKPGNAKIKFSVVEDVFGLPLSLFNPPTTEWENPNQLPSPLQYLRMDTAPYFLVANFDGDGPAEEMEYPEARVMLLATQHSGEARAIDYLNENSDLTGNIGFRAHGALNQTGLGKLSSSLPITGSSDIFPLLDYDGPEPEAGMLVLIATDEDDEIHELGAIESASSSSIVVRRGVLDTAPKAWTIGSSVWLIDPDSLLPDPTVRAVGETVRYKFLPATSLGKLPVSSAPTEEIEVTERQYRPYRPANVKVGGSIYSPIVVGLGATTVSWSRRNRLTETSIVLRWTDGDVTPEAGQTTTLQVLKDGDVLETFSGIAGTSQALNLEDYPEIDIGDEVVFRLFSVRSGLQSLEAVEIIATVVDNTGGWGNNYGNSYG